MKRILFLSIIMGCITGISCNMQINPDDEKTKLLLNDSTITNVENVVQNKNDSIYKILLSSKKIKCEDLTSGHKHDNLNDSVRVLSEGQSAIVKFLLDDANNRHTDNVVYGVFSPSIKITCFQSKKLTATALFDFGLHKWQLLDSKGKEVGTYDLKANEILLAKCFCGIFPDDEVLKAFENSLLETK